MSSRGLTHGHGMIQATRTLGMILLREIVNIPIIEYCYIQMDTSEQNC